MPGSFGSNADYKNNNNNTKSSSEEEEAVGA